jgi:hypothetical protein
MTQKIKRNEIGMGFHAIYDLRKVMMNEPKV